MLYPLSYGGVDGILPTDIWRFSSGVPRLYGNMGVLYGYTGNDGRFPNEDHHRDF